MPTFFYAIIAAIWSFSNFEGADRWFFFVSPHKIDPAVSGMKSAQIYHARRATVLAGMVGLYPMAKHQPIKHHHPSVKNQQPIK